MAGTGLVFVGFVLIHMYGNLKSLQGEEAFNTYAEHLRTFGEPILPREGLLWILRVGLIVSILLWRSGPLGALSLLYTPTAMIIAQAAIVPGSFSPIPKFYAYAALILGGVARIWGPVVGSMIFWVLLSFSQGLINELVANEYIPRSILDANQAGNVRFVLVGLGLMLLLIFRPQGIFGDRREIALQDR